MNKKEQEMLDKMIMKLIKEFSKQYGVYAFFEEVQEWLNNLNEKNKYKSYKVDCSLKNFNYRQHRQEIANAECYKLIKSNAEILSKWNYFAEERKLYSKDFKNAYVEIYLASVKTCVFAQENKCFLSNECRRSLNNHMNNLEEWLDKLMNLIESSKEEE